MSFAVKILRLCALLSWLLFMGAVSLPVSFRRDRWLAIEGMTKKIGTWGRGLLRILNIKLEIHGCSDAFKGGFVVSNHLSYVDILAHSAVFGFRFAPKSDIRGWPFLGWYVGLTHPVWVDRSSKRESQETLQEFKETLRRGISLMVYPEGTSSDGSAGVLPFKSTPFEAVAAEDFPIQPVLTFYRVPEGCPTPCWYGDMTLVPHIWRLLGIPETVAELHFLPQIRSEGRDRKALAEHVRSLMQKECERIAKAPDSSGGAVELEPRTQ